MSSQVLLRPPSTTLSIQQNLAMVQIFMNASIACICMERGLIPHDSLAFQDRCVADLLSTSRSARPLSYKQFLDLKATRGESQRFKILVSGRHKKGNGILELLEGGVFEALQKGYLESVQLTLAVDPQRRSKVFECYTFSFTYQVGNSHETSPRVQSIGIAASPQRHILVDVAQQNFKLAIRQLLRLLQGLPPLPRRRSLGINLFYTPSCPLAYEPKGFIGSTDTQMSFLDRIEQGWCKESQPCDGFDGGFYRVDVLATYLKPTLQESSENYPHTTKVDSELTCLHLEDIATSKKLQQMQRSSSRPGSQLVPTEEEEIRKTTPAPAKQSDVCQPPDPVESSSCGAVDEQVSSSGALQDHIPDGKRKRVTSAGGETVLNERPYKRKMSISQIMIDFNLSSESSSAVNQDDDDRYSEVTRTEDVTETGDDEDFS